MTVWSESYTCLSPAESGPGNPSDGCLGSWRYLKAKCTKEIYIQTSFSTNTFLVLEGVGFGYTGMPWGWDPRWRCCSSWRGRNAAVCSREVVWVKSCWEKYVSASWMCSLLQSPSALWYGREACQSHDLLQQLGLCSLVRCGDFCPWMLEAEL